MEFTQSWFAFDPKDLRTHPEEGMNVEMEFDDGHVVEGMWEIDDLFEVGQTVDAGSTIKRWRYTMPQSLC